jgi:hypothetical protein
MLLEQVWQRQRLDADPTRLDQDDWAAGRDISDLKGKLRDTDSFGIGYLVSRLRSVCKFETSAHMTSLVRLRVGPYALDDVSMPCLQTEKELSNPEKILSCLQAVSVTAPQPASSPVAKPPSSAA